MHIHLGRLGCSCVAIAGLTLGVGSASAVSVSETEGNDTFANRNVFGPTTTEITGTFGSVGTAIQFNTALTPSTVSEFRINGQTPGTPFFAFTAVDAGASEPDTLLRTLDESLAQIAEDDDGGPFGGLSSGLSGSVNPDGTINLDVTDFTDDLFGGAHTESYPFDLYVQLNTSTFVGDNMDVEFFTVSGLTPGDPFEVEVLNAQFDTVLGVFNQAGTKVKDSDDFNGLLSRISGTVNADGTANFALGAYDDFDFDGLPGEDEGEDIGGGDYTIAFRPGVPEPSAVALIAVGGLAVLRRRR